MTKIRSQARIRIRIDTWCRKAQLHVVVVTKQSYLLTKKLYLHSKYHDTPLFGSMLKLSLVKSSQFFAYSRPKNIHRQNIVRQKYRYRCRTANILMDIVLSRNSIFFEITKYKELTMNICFSKNHDLAGQKNAFKGPKIGV